MSNPLVLYHGGGCVDGFTAAWCAFLKFGDKAEYRPVNYSEPPPDVAGRDVYVLDFSFRRAVTVEMTQRAKKFVCLDHHQTAAAELAGLSAGSDDGLIRLDMAHSGARLAWDYFYGDKDRPELVDIVEDRDLWRWKLSDSREINAAVRSYPFDFPRWSMWVNFWPAFREDLVKEGRAILRYQDEVVGAHVKHAREVVVAGHKVLAVNATTLFSEIAGELAKGRPFGVAYFRRGDGKWQYSLRSDGDGLDVSAVAKTFGGGGHAHAAGYESDSPPQ
jgi:hypothetical protein